MVFVKGRSPARDRVRGRREARLSLVENAGFQFVARVPRREERQDLGCRSEGVRGAIVRWPHP